MAPHTDHDVPPASVITEGALVRYHGSLTEHHGIWTVRALLRYGSYQGRFVLENPDNPRETLIPSRPESFTVLRRARP